jgi:hypothetical protein
MSTTARARRPARKTTAAAAAPAAPKAVVKAPPKAAKASKPVPAAATAEAKPPKKAKPVLIRDGFTMPEADFALIAALKKRAAIAGRESKKSELLRAGLQALAALDAKALVAALGALEPVKIGRPRKGH